LATDKCSLLVVDDEPYILPTLAALLGGDFDVVTADSADAAMAIMARRPIDLILTDQRMPRTNGVQLLEWVRNHHPKTIRLLMTGFAELEDAVEAINRGHVYYYLTKPWRTEDLHQILRNATDKLHLERRQEQLIEELRKHKEELEKRVAERTRDLEEANTLLQQRTRELERLILIDPLTGLFNRRAVEGLALAELKRHNRYRNPLAIGILDIDHFKRINTEFDLPGGDEALKGLARVLTTTLREVDSVGRIGGEEFLVIARETNGDGATRLAERIRSAVAAATFQYRGHPITMTISLGFAVAEEGVAAEFAPMYQLAANGLNAAKRAGRNRFVLRTYGGAEHVAAAEEVIAPSAQAGT
jgi:diguanylate cyclase (GGDEF)-like protein